MALACKLCIMAKGLRGDQVGDLPQNEEEFADHLEREHHVIVQREGESLKNALERVMANPDTCPECVESAKEQLAAL